MEERLGRNGFLKLDWSLMQWNVGNRPPAPATCLVRETRLSVYVCVCVCVCACGGGVTCLFFCNMRPRICGFPCAVRLHRRAPPPLPVIHSTAELPSLFQFSLTGRSKITLTQAVLCTDKQQTDRQHHKWISSPTVLYVFTGNDKLDLICLQIRLRILIATNP